MKKYSGRTQMIPAGSNIYLRRTERLTGIKLTPFEGERL
jgi:hypothetical protein